MLTVYSEIFPFLLKAVHCQSVTAVGTEEVQHVLFCPNISAEFCFILTFDCVEDKN